MVRTRENSLSADEACDRRPGDTLLSEARFDGETFFIEPKIVRSIIQPQRS